MEDVKLNRIKKRILVLALAGVLILPTNAVMANELEEIEIRQNEISETNQLIQNQQYHIQKANEDLEYAFSQLDNLSSEMDSLKADINSLEQEIKELNESIELNEAKKKELEAKLEEQIEVFKKRLDVMYKNRKNGYIPVILSSDDVDDFLSKLNTMKSVAEYDKKLIENMKTTKKALDMVLLNLKGEKASRDEAMTNLKIKEANLMDSINDQRQLIAVIQNNRDLAADQIAELEQRVYSLNAEIQDLNVQLKERLAREEEERRLAEEAARKAEEERLAREAEERRQREALERSQQETDNLVSQTSELSSVETTGRNIVPDANFKPFDGNIVYYNQREEPWGSAKYGNGWAATIAANGCGPTSMAMVLSSMTDQQVTPIEMANFSTANGHVMPGDGGSYWSLFPAAANAYGLSCRQTTSRSEIIDALSNGALVIASQNNALGNYWTYGGHFIVLTGITDSGNITVADPWSRGHSVVSHTQDQVFIPMKSAWIITQ